MDQRIFLDLCGKMKKAFNSEKRLEITLNDNLKAAKNSKRIRTCNREKRADAAKACQRLIGESAYLNRAVFKDIVPPTSNSSHSFIYIDVEGISDKQPAKS